MKASAVPIYSTGLISRLIADYLQDSANIRSFVAAPFTEEGAEDIILRRTFEASGRTILADTLLNQYDGLQTNDLVLSNIQSLREPNCYTVTTGHQLCLATGPIYFIYKIISTIRLANNWNKRYPDKKFIPIYWMATEDHDFAEINHVALYGKTLSWESQQTGAVGKMATQGIDTLLDLISGTLGTELQSAQIIEELHKAYGKNSLADATRYLVNSLFAQYGLVIIDANHRVFKQQAVSLFRSDLFRHTAHEYVGKTSEELRKLGYDTQVNPREVNLFFLSDGQRNRIERMGSDNWRVVDTEQIFSGEEIEKMLSGSPEVFSPNVIMRPAYQELTLPNVAYVGGPGELAYWMQLYSYFKQENIQYPLLVLRDSAFLISSRMHKRMEKAGVHESDLFLKKEQVIRQVVERSGVPDLSDEKEKLIALFSSVIAKARQTDPTLEGAANAELQKQLSSIDGLEKRIFKAAKNREEIKVQQVEKIWQELFPEGIPQERHESILPFIAAGGFGILDDLLGNFDPMEKTYKLLLTEN